MNTAIQDDEPSAPSASRLVADFTLSPADLEEKYGAPGHPDFSREDFCYEVTNDDTRLGYWEWVLHQVESAYFDADLGRVVAAREEMQKPVETASPKPASRPRGARP